MSVLIACLAIAVALTALWFASEAMHRADRFSAALVKPHLGPLREAMRRQDKTLAALRANLDAIERDVRMLKKAGAPTEDVESRLAAAAANLGDADRFTPSRILNA